MADIFSCWIAEGGTDSAMKFVVIKHECMKLLLLIVSLAYVDKNGHKKTKRVVED